MSSRKGRISSLHKRVGKERAPTAKTIQKLLFPKLAQELHENQGTNKTVEEWESFIQTIVASCQQVNTGVSLNSSLVYVGDEK